MPNHTTQKSPNFFWPDGSFFQYDLPPRDVIHGWANPITGGVYDLPDLPSNEWKSKFTGWSNWLDKFQKDYRFANVSDNNARANIYPEVDDPWMFTEYVAQATGKSNWKDDATAVGSQIVSPTVLAPHKLVRNYTFSGNIPSLNTTLTPIDNQPASTVPIDVQPVFELENLYRSEVPPNNEYWQSDLDAMNWIEYTTSGANKRFTRLPAQRRVIKYGVPRLNSGVRLYRRAIATQATRFGHSQNIPERVMTMTAPKDFFRPDGVLTGRIVPHITIISGIPLYDPLQNAANGEQAAIQYIGYTQGLFNVNSTITLFDRTPVGPNGSPDGQFTYTATPSGTAGGISVNMPRNNLVSMTFNAPNYADSDLVHHGCQFWVGRKDVSTGTCAASCSLFTQMGTQFQELWSSTLNYSNPTGTVPSLTVQPYDPSQDELVVEFQTTTPSSRWFSMEECGKQVHATLNSLGHVASITVTNTDGTAAYPLKLKSQGGFVDTPGLGATLRIRRFSKKRPVPVPNLCAMYGGTTKDDAKTAYNQAGGKCSFYTPVGVRVVGSYQAKAQNGAEWANLQRGLPDGYKKGPLETQAGQALSDFADAAGAGGMGIASFMAMNYAMNQRTPDPYTKGAPAEDIQNYQVTYEPEIVPLDGKSTYYNTATGKPPPGPEPEAAIRVTRGSGEKMLEMKEDSPYGGVDTIFFGMINQINYRLMHNVMHCYRTDKCGKYISNPNGADGWQRGRYANIDFTSSPLKMPGYPAVTSTEFCHYGDGRCPYTRVDRRAVEFDANYQVLRGEILRTFRNSGIAGFAKYGIKEAFLANNQVRFLVQSDVTPATQGQSPQYKDAMACAVMEDSLNPPIIGHYQPVVNGADGKKYRVFFFYDRPSWDSFHNFSRVLAHIIQFDDDNNPCYMNVPSNQMSDLDVIYGDHTKIPWLVELFDNYVSPQGNVTYATNEKPFAGGRSPEYHDMSQRGRELICSTAGYEDNEFMQGATFTNQFGGPLFNRAPISGVGKRSYWIQKNGIWMLDGNAIGPTEALIGVDPRIQNHPPVIGHNYPIAGVPGMTLQNPDDPSQDSNSNYARIAHTYTNDTPAWLAYLRANWNDLLPIDPDTGDPIKVGPPSADNNYLPTQRYYYRCTVCGIEFPEEEVNFFLAPDSNSNPIYPAPQGSPSGSCGCPRKDGGYLALAGTYDRLMGCYSRGEVSIWAPPGTTVKSDSYFWKNPTLVNRVHVDQITQKLGKYNPGGGGYTLADLGPAVDQMGRLPLTSANSYSPGLNREIAAPWAHPGQSISNVRTTVKDWFVLQDDDVPVLLQEGQQPNYITDEQGTLLQQNDRVVFIRKYKDGSWAIIGLPVVASGTTTALILKEIVVKQDTPMPKRSDYATDDVGDRLFQYNLRNWLLQCVAFTDQAWSTSLSMKRNALSDQLATHGLSPTLGYPFDPKTGQMVDLDERVISAYGQNEGEGLRLITINDLKRLRNRIVPMLAYDLGADTYTAGGDYTQSVQQSHSQRLSTLWKGRPLPGPVFGVVPPQVMAATQTGRDYYVEWEIGDVEGTTARAYYPVGTTWWRMNQVVGQIKRSGGSNALHLDDASRSDYTGDVVTSVVAFFLHGRIPMDKEVTRAYLIFTPGDGPSADAIGCQGQYTGFVGWIGGSGAVHFDHDPANPANDSYVGNSFCYWQHFHPYTVDHEPDRGGYDVGDSYWDQASRLHVIYHATPWKLKKNNPNEPWLLSDSQQRAAKALEENPISLATCPIQLNGYSPWLDGDDNQLYLQHIDFMQMSYADDSYGFSDLHQPFFRTWNFGEDLVQLLTEHAIWKDLSFDQYQNIQDNYHVRGQAAVNTTESLLTFDYYAGYFRNNVWPREQQGIPGLINYSGYDSSGRFSKFINVEQKTFDPNWVSGGQVIFQSDSTTGSGIVYTGGGNGSQQAGSSEKVLNITDTIKRIYNDRVAMFYTVQLGQKYSDLYGFVSAKTDTNLGLADRFHKNIPYPPEYFWNYRYMRAGLGMWLNDPWHHPALNNDVPLVAGDSGDPLPQTLQDKQSRLIASSFYTPPGFTGTLSPYNPINIYGTYKDAIVFNENSSSSLKPVPAIAGNNYWLTADARPSTETLTADLRQVPYETMRRPWRYQAPSIDSTNAICPNISCWVHQKGWTVGQLYANATTTWGVNVVPSTSSARCASCNTLMTAKDGVVYKDGDNVLTVSYDPPFVDDALINAVEVSLNSNDVFQSVKHGFVIEYFNSTVKQWRALVTVEYDETTKKYTWLEWNGTAFANRTDSVFPTTFLGFEQANGLPKNPSAAAGHHFGLVTAMKMRLKVYKPAKLVRQEPAAGGWSTFIPDGVNLTISNAVFDATEYPTRIVTFKDVTTGNTMTATIKTATASGSDVVTILDKTIPSNFTQYQMSFTQYIAKCSKFNIYGFPYSKGDITITPPGFLQPAYISIGTNQFRLTAFPTQVCRFSCTCGEIEVPMTQASSFDPKQGFRWTVVQDTYAGTSYLKIRSGVWYYDAASNSVMLPTTFIDPTDSQEKSIWSMNSGLYTDTTNTFTLKTLPALLMIEYFTGAGVGLDVTATATGNGPAWQLDRECVCFIANNTDDDEPVPQGVVSDALPPMGNSLPLKTLNGRTYPLRWMVYNHEPLVWQQSIGWIVGNELGAGNWDDNSVLGMFSGNHGTNLATPGNNSVLRGKVTGTVTLYGTPNTLISGNLAVYAKAVTNRTYNMPDGSTVQTYERTGGYRSGAFVFRLEVADQVVNRRTSISCGVPRVIVYLKERKLTDPLENT